MVTREYRDTQGCRDDWENTRFSPERDVARLPWEYSSLGPWFQTGIGIEQELLYCIDPLGKH